MGGAVSTILALRLRKRGYDIAQVSNPHPPHMQSLKTNQAQLTVV